MSEDVPNYAAMSRRDLRVNASVAAGSAARAGGDDPDNCHRLLAYATFLATMAITAPDDGAVSDVHDFQDRGEAARRAAGIDGTAGDTQDIPHRYVRDESTGACLLCGMSETYRKHTEDVSTENPKSATSARETRLSSTFTWEGITYDLSVDYMDRDRDTWTFVGVLPCGMPLVYGPTKDRETLGHVVSEWGPLSPVGKPYTSGLVCECGYRHDA